MVWWKTWFYKDENKKHIGKFKSRMPWNIYEDKDLNTHLKKFHKIHYVWKYKFLVPLLLLSKKWFLPKKLVVPKKEYNANFLIFDLAFEKSLKDWLLQYQMVGQRGSLKDWKKKLKNGYAPVDSLRIMKEHVLYMCLNDTAYREFFNVLMFNISNEMNKEYSKEKYPDGVGHLFYAQRDPYDVHYKILFKEIRQNLAMTMLDASKILKEAEEKKK